MNKNFAGFGALLLTALSAVVPGAAQDPPWFSLLGQDPVFQDSMRKMLTSQEKAVNGLNLPDPTLDYLSQNPNGNWQTMGDVLAAFVNIHKLSGDQKYADLAKQIADWFIAWNDYLVAQRDPTFPYLGWGKDPRRGYFNGSCAEIHNFTPVAGPNGRTDYDASHADEAWDTAAAVRGLIKYSEIDPARTGSVYFQRAKSILENWPSRDHASNDGNPGTPGLVNDGPYAAAGMRWYAKSNEPCEVRYVKNTNIVMGEQLFRAYKASQDPKYLQAATKVLDAQLWDMISHRNFGYDSFMIYVNKSDPIFAVMAADRDRSIVTHSNPGQPDDEIRCKDPSTGESCWNHLGFEAYDLYVIQQLTSDLAPSAFPVANTQADLAQAISSTMTVYRTSVFGNTTDFDWGCTPSPGIKCPSRTHVTAYNCAQRFSGDTLALSECVSALSNAPSGGTIFYSLVPDGIFTQGPAR